MHCLPIRSGVGSSEPRPARGRSRIIRFSAPFEGILKLWRGLGAQPATGLPDTESRLQSTSAEKKAS